MLFFTVIPEATVPHSSASVSQRNENYFHFIQSFQKLLTVTYHPKLCQSGTVDILILPFHSFIRLVCIGNSISFLVRNHLKKVQACQCNVLLSKCGLVCWPKANVKKCYTITSVITQWFSIGFQQCYTNLVLHNLSHKTMSVYASL